MPADLDTDTATLLASIEQGLADAAHGAVTTHTPQAIKARRGRPVGSVQAVTKSAITLRLPPDALAKWRASGKGWQTRAAEVLTKMAP